MLSLPPLYCDYLDNSVSAAFPSLPLVTEIVTGIMRENFSGDPMPNLMTHHDTRTCAMTGGSPLVSRIVHYFIKKAPVLGAFFCLFSACAEEFIYG